MQIKSLAFLAASIIASLFSMSANASTDVYTQALGSGLSTSAVLNLSTDPGFQWTTDRDQQMWAYFSTPTNVSFNRISWYGTKADGNFAVDLFSATCFSCGATQVSGSGTFPHAATPYNSLTLLPNSGPFSQTQAHQTLVSGSGYTGLYSYYIDLPSNVTLSSNNTYALSVVNNYTSLPFAWAGSSSGTSLVFNVGQAQFLKSPGGLAFTLSNVSAVPEPDPALLMGVGLLGLLVVARKRKTA